MGKGKGHQAGGFASKAMNRQFDLEWREQLPLQRKRRSPITTISTTTSERERPRIRLNSLQGLLQEREYEDRIEHRTMRQKKSTMLVMLQRPFTTKPHTTAPGWVVYHGQQQQQQQPPPSSGHLPCNRVSCSLQSISLQALAPVLPDYIDAWGSDMVHHYLSLLPEDTLTELSVRVSSTIGMTNALCKVLGQHPHVRCLSLVAPRTDDEDDSTWRALTDDAILELVPQWGLERNTIPETWEEDTSDIHGSWKGCVKLQRLELGHLPHLTLDTLSILLHKCSGITHLGLMGSLSYESGPEFLWNIHNWLPNLQVLDLSHTPWLTEGLVRGILEAYGCKLIVKATGSLPLTSQVTLENDYPKHFWSETNIDKLEHTFVPSNCGAAS